MKICILIEQLTGLRLQQSIMDYKIVVQNEKGTHDVDLFLVHHGRKEIVFKIIE